MASILAKEYIQADKYYMSAGLEVDRVKEAAVNHRMMIHVIGFPEVRGVMKVALEEARRVGIGGGATDEGAQAAIRGGTTFSLHVVYAPHKPADVDAYKFYKEQDNVYLVTVGEAGAIEHLDAAGGAHAVWKSYYHWIHKM